MNLNSMENREWGEYSTSPEEIEHEKRMKKVKEDMQDRAFEKKRKEEEEERMRGPSADELREKERKNDAAVLEQMAKLDEERRREDKGYQERYDALKEEKAPPEHADSLVKEKMKLELDEKTTVDLQEAIPILAERLCTFAKENKNDPEALRAADNDRG